MVSIVARLTHILAVVACLAALAQFTDRALAQGETTSAIVGTVVDPSGAALAGATVTIVGTETGSRRSAKTDDAGRFNFPQLKPGSYSVSAEAEGFEPQTNKSVSAGLGQRQTVAFMLHASRGKRRGDGDRRGAPGESREPEHIDDAERRRPWRTCPTPVAI